MALVGHLDLGLRVPTKTKRDLGASVFEAFK